MKVQEALDHDWQVGEKLWEVYYKYNSDITTRGGIFRTRQPVGVIEITVTKAERRKAETGWFESINIELNADWGLDEDDNCYINTCIGGMITYRSSGGSYYSNKEFCQDKHDPKLNKSVLDLYQKANNINEGKKGGILFSVCRGSCSEGMNFSNDAARLVIVVGIPFAYLGDPKTQLRKEYQDEFNKYYYAFIKDKNIKKLSGAEWYNQNAIKCVNQALGRVIRHSNDYGCMLLIDSRYQQNNNKYLISKWIRDVCIIYNDKNNENLVSNVQNFFKDQKISPIKK